MHCLQQSPQMASCQLHLFSSHLQFLLCVLHSAVLRSLLMMWTNLRTSCLQHYWSYCNSEILSCFNGIFSCFLIQIIATSLIFPSAMDLQPRFLFQKNLTRLYFTSIHRFVRFLRWFLLITLTQLSPLQYKSLLFITHTWFPLRLKCWSQDNLPEFLLWFYQPIFVSFPGIPLSCDSEYKWEPYKLGPSVGHLFVILSCISLCGSLFWAGYAIFSCPCILSESAAIHFFHVFLLQTILKTHRKKKKK